MNAEPRNASNRDGGAAAKPPRWMSGDAMLAAVPMGAAIRAVQRELRAGLDPANDLARSIVDLDRGQLLYMPSRFGDYVGAKVSTVAPENPAMGRDRIQGVYVLMDAATLGPIMLMDGRTLTALRTPAVSAAVADFLAPEHVENLVVFGSGPQAAGHVEAMMAIRSIDHVSIVARDRDRAASLVGRLATSGVPADLATAEAVRGAQIVVCATTSRTALFDGTLVADDALVVAIGSHEPDAREVDSALVARAQLVVEDPTVALREAGDLLIPIGEGLVDATSLIPMRDVVTGAVVADRSRPRVFSSSGMPWEDLVVAAEIYRVSR